MLVEARRKLFTVEEFQRTGEAGIFGDDVRVELLRGEIFEMPPPGPPHQGKTDRLAARLFRGFGDRAIVRVQGPVVLNDNSQPLPDLAVLRPRDDFYELDHPRPPDILLLVEICDSSRRRDRRDKLPRYAAAGIAEVWMFDIGGRRIEVHREPDGARYTVTQVLSPGDSIAPSAFPDVVLDVADLVG